MKVLPSPLEFEWDRGNSGENLKSHGVTDQECEEGFFDAHKKILKEILYLEKEEHCLMIGKTQRDRLLFVVFTVRKNKIRVISARDLNRKEKHLYEEKTSPSET